MDQLRLPFFVVAVVALALAVTAEIGAPELIIVFAGVATGLAALALALLMIAMLPDSADRNKLSLAAVGREALLRA